MIKYKYKTTSSSSYLDLLVGRYSTEHYFCEALRRKHPEADPTNHTAIFDQRQCLVFSAQRK